MHSGAKRPIIFPLPMHDVDDIEDIVPSLDERDSRFQRPARVRGKLGAHGSMGGPAGTVPGAQRVWVKTFGCSHNISDSEFMAGQLQEFGYRQVARAGQTPCPARRPSKMGSTACGPCVTHVHRMAAGRMLCLCLFCLLHTAKSAPLCKAADPRTHGA